MSLEQPPVRLCCYERHWGVQCADGGAMCCLCFGKFLKGDLFVDADGATWDVCVPCELAEWGHE